jgi:hypothetical protein
MSADTKEPSIHDMWSSGTGSSKESRGQVIDLFERRKWKTEVNRLPFFRLAGELSSFGLALADL